MALTIALIPAAASAADGQVLITQASVVAAGGFPYTITQPGSYKLATNLVVPGLIDGIHIEADRVTLDLNGFTILGPCSAVPCVVLATVGIKADRNGVEIRNGTVSGFNTGIFVTHSGRLADLTADHNGAEGFSLTNVSAERLSANNNFYGVRGFGSTLSQILAVDNFYGIQANGGAVTESVARGNNVGIDLTNATLLNSLATANTGWGVGASTSTFGNNTIVGNILLELVVVTGYSQGTNLCGNVPC